MKHLLLLLMLFPVFGFSQSIPQLQQASHTIALSKDSLTVFQEAEFYTIVDWYADSDTLKFSGTTILLNIYYKPDPFAIGSMPYANFALDTFAIDPLSIGAHTLIVNSFEKDDSVDINFNYYEFFTLQDSDTSYFEVLSDHSISFTESPISFYPNPAKENLTIEGLKPEDGEVEVSILDMNGKKILQAQVSYQQPALTLPALPKGTYLVKTSTSSVFQKLRIE